MNIEKQVCSLEQGKKLKELGVIHPCNEFWYDRNGNLYMVDRLIGFPNRRRLNDETLHNATTVGDFFPAFTVAELGEMIGTWMDNESEPPPDFLIDKYGQTLSIVFNPLFLADLLIYLIEYWRITATEVNKLLNEAA